MICSCFVWEILSLNNSILEVENGCSIYISISIHFATIVKVAKQGALLYLPTTTVGSTKHGTLNRSGENTLAETARTSHGMLIVQRELGSSILRHFEHELVITFQRKLFMLTLPNLISSLIYTIFS